METTTLVYLCMAILFLHLFLKEYLPTVLHGKCIVLKTYNVDRISISSRSLQTILVKQSMGWER